MDERQASPFHVFHKVPAGDGLYVRAKHAQLVDKDPHKAIALFRAALEAGDRVDSALKDMAIVLKQQNRPQDAILAISTFRTRCSDSAQDSLDNVLLDLYKSCGRLDEQIALLIRKLELFNHCQTFNGKRTKTARSQGKKFQVSVEQETARLLGNLGWAYMQQSSYGAAESVYRRALALEVDNNKLCNLGVCLMKQGRAEEAMQVLRRASYVHNRRANSESHLKSYERAQELMRQASAMSAQARQIPFTSDDGDESSAATASGSWSFDSPWQERMQTHQDLGQTFPWSSTSHAGAQVHDRPSNACPQIKISTEEDAQNISQQVAAAWLSVCNDAQESNDRDSTRQDTGFASEEADTTPTDLILNGECASLLPPAPCLVPLPSGDLFGSAQGRRRLPVFRELTVLGSAAA